MSSLHGPAPVVALRELQPSSGKSHVPYRCSGDTEGVPCSAPITPTGAHHCPLACAPCSHCELFFFFFPTAPQLFLSVDFGLAGYLRLFPAARFLSALPSAPTRGRDLPAASASPGATRTSLRLPRPAAAARGPAGGARGRRRGRAGPSHPRQCWGMAPSGGRDETLLRRRAGPVRLQRLGHGPPGSAPGPRSPVPIPRPLPLHASEWGPSGAGT